MKRKIPCKKYIVLYILYTYTRFRSLSIAKIFLRLGLHDTSNFPLPPRSPQESDHTVDTRAHLSDSLDHLYQILSLIFSYPVYDLQVTLSER